MSSNACVAKSPCPACTACGAGTTLHNADDGSIACVASYDGCLAACRAARGGAWAFTCERSVVAAPPKDGCGGDDAES